MDTEKYEALKYFTNRIKTLERRLYHADKRGTEKEITELRMKIRYCRIAVRALSESLRQEQGSPSTPSEK